MLVNGNVDSYDRETSEYIVAYIDLLGIKSEMQKGFKEQQLAMNKLYNLYTHSIDTTRMIAWEENKDIDLLCRSFPRTCRYGFSWMACKRWYIYWTVVYR